MEGYAELIKIFKCLNTNYMIPVAFDYQKVKTVDEAMAALSNGAIKILAGGHSL